MQPLERSAAVAEVGGEPVEEFGMCGERAVSTEVVWRLHEAAAEMVRKRLALLVYAASDGRNGS